MTIRFTCAECASVLKIKDELAGTSGRCPKCKTKFFVPEARSERETSEDHEGVVVASDAAESSQGHASASSESRHLSPVEHPSIPIVADLAEKQPDAIPLRFNPEETLRLDDSDDDFQMGQ